MCKLKKIMLLTDSNQREVSLREYARSLGCSLDSSYTADGKHLEDIIITRILEAERHQRENGLWVIAVISAIASVVSALAAWAAVIHK